MLRIAKLLPLVSVDTNAPYLSHTWFKAQACVEIPPDGGRWGGGVHVVSWLNPSR